MTIITLMQADPIANSSRPHKLCIRYKITVSIIMICVLYAYCIVQVITLTFETVPEEERSGQWREGVKTIPK